MKIRAYNAGRPRVKIYQYDSKFLYMRSYESQVEIFDKYYNGKKGELFRNKEYKELPDGTFISTYRIGRKGLQYWTKIYNSVYCSKNVQDKPFSAYNYLDEKVASFANLRVAAALMPEMGYNTINCSLNANKYNKTSKRQAHKGLYFKYD